MPPPSYMHRLKTISRVKHSALTLLVDLHTVGKDTAEREKRGKICACACEVAWYQRVNFVATYTIPLYTALKVLNKEKNYFEWNFSDFLSDWTFFSIVAGYI